MNTGDIVTLNSGGPDMTINRIDDGKAECVWFDGRKSKRASLPIDCLTRRPDAPLAPSGHAGEPATQP